MRRIGGLFGRSAWGPLWEHLEKARECLTILLDSISVFIRGDTAKLEEAAGRVSAFEKEADMIKEGIRQRLTRSVFSSVERSEIMAWLRQQDGIADSCQDIVRLFSIRKTEVPFELRRPLTVLAGRVVKMADGLVEAVKMFGNVDIAEAGKKDTAPIISLIECIQKGKDTVDSLQGGFLKALFNVEGKMDPVTVFLLYNSSGRIARIADRIENVGDIMRHMLSL